MTRDPKDFYPTPEEATYPILSELISNGAADGWYEILDLGSGDGRLGASAKAAAEFADPGMERTASGVELDDDMGDRSLGMLDCVHYGDLRNMDGDLWPDPDLVISNPPFTLALEFLEFALNYHRLEFAFADVLFLLPVGYMGSQKRHAFWKANPPDAMRVFSKRLSFTGDGKTANADYAWFYWGGALQGIDFYL
jgi:hypothetical protein